MGKVSHSKEELLDYLREQIRFLVSSANSYDRGFEGEAKRLAVVIRVLVHDTSNSTSLLTLLGKKDIDFYDSGLDWELHHKFSPTGLADIQFSPPSELKYCAPLDNLWPGKSKLKKVSFDDWWNKVIWLDNKQNRLNRKELIVNVVNKLGGAHVDPKLDKAYERLATFDSPSWKFIARQVALDSGGSEFVVSEVVEDFKNSALLANIRQIAHEVLKTLKDEFPDLF